MLSSGMTVVVKVGVGGKGVAVGDDVAVAAVVGVDVGREGEAQPANKIDPTRRIKI
jgi:hypothetical protein